MSTYYVGSPPNNYSGGPFYIAANSGAPSHQFTGGTIFFAPPTALQNNKLFDSQLGCLSLPYTAYRSGYNGGEPRLVGDEDTGITKAIAGGTFATMVADKYVILTFTSQLAGIATTVLNSPGSSFRKSQNLNIGWVDTWLHSKVLGWYYLNGKLISWQMSRDNIHTETYPGSYSVPGRLSYNSTGKNPTIQSYYPKTD